MVVEQIKRKLHLQGGTENTSKNWTELKVQRSRDSSHRKVPFLGGEGATWKWHSLKT